MIIVYNNYYTTSYPHRIKRSYLSYIRKHSTSIPTSQLELSINSGNRLNLNTERRNYVMKAHITEKFTETQETKIMRAFVGILNFLRFSLVKEFSGNPPGQFSPGFFILFHVYVSFGGWEILSPVES